MPAGRYTTAAERRAFYHEVIRRARTVPGVEAAALAMPLPFGPVNLVLDASFAIVGRPELSPEQWPVANITRASPAYFKTMRIPLRAGRSFTPADIAGAPAVVIVSEALVRRYFAGQNPLGQHLLLGRRNSIPFEIVGVAGDLHHNDLRSDFRPEIYLPIDVAPQNSAALVIRTSGNPAGFLPAVQRRIWALDPDLAANLAAPVEQILYRSLSPARTVGLY